MKNYFTAISLADKHAKICVADESVTIQGSHKIPLLANVSPDNFLATLEQGVFSLLKKKHIQTESVNGIAVSVPATVDYKKGGIECSSTIPLLNGINIKEKITTSLKKFVVVETEANVRAYSEYKLGHTKGYKNFILILLEKKISAGVYVNGWLIRNKSGSTSELGHIIIEPHGRRCKCSNRGCLEAYASSDAIVRYYLKYKRGAPNKKITFDDVYKLAQKSDSAALDAFYRMGNYLGIAMTTIINLISPDAVIFSGEVSKALKFFLPAVQSTLSARTYSLPLKDIVYKKSDLSDDDRMRGLLHLAKDSYTKAYDLRINDDIFVI